MQRGTRGKVRFGALLACSFLFGALAGCGGGNGATSTTGSTNSTNPTTQGAGSGGASIASSGYVTLAWQVPTTNTNGSMLTNLAGYVINYGQSASALNNTVKIDAPTTVSYVVDNLEAGTWYFAISAVASDGTQSALSNVVSTTVQ